MKMNVKRMAIAGFAVVALASAGRAASAHTLATSGNTPVTSSDATAGPDTNNIREGDQATPDNAVEAVSEQATDTGGGSTAESDGSGGHEDPPGNVDHQFQGQE